jgi:hypothetical protein
MLLPKCALGVVKDHARFRFLSVQSTVILRRTTLM